MLYYSVSILPCRFLKVARCTGGEEMSPEMFQQILEGLSEFFKAFGISLPDIIAQLQPMFETIIGMFT